MESLIDKTLEIARSRFSAFGFDDVQMEKLLASGERDLRQELDRLHGILSGPSVSAEEIAFSLHAIKGLVANLGNDTLASQINTLEEKVDQPAFVEEVRSAMGFV